MEVVNRRCAGLDVHKKSISACVLISGPGEGQAEVEKGTFGTFTSELMELKNWLQLRGVTHVVMESLQHFVQPPIKRVAWRFRQFAPVPKRFLPLPLLPCPHRHTLILRQNISGRKCFLDTGC